MLGTREAVGTQRLMSLCLQGAYQPAENKVHINNSNARETVLTLKAYE